MSLVRVRGQWVQLDPKEIEAALAFWGQAEAGCRPACGRSCGWRSARRERRAGWRSKRWRRQAGWRSGSTRLNGSASLETLPAPEGFHGSAAPLPAARLRVAALPGAVGTGRLSGRRHGPRQDRTDAGLSAQPVERGRQTAHALVICPTSVVGNWHREAQRFSPDLPVMVHHGLTRTKGDDSFRQRGRSPWPRPLQLRPAPSGLRTVAGRPLEPGLCWTRRRISRTRRPSSRRPRGRLQADWRIALSGTPVENHVGDLWAILEFLNPGFLGSQAEFKRNFYFPIQAESRPGRRRTAEKDHSPLHLAPSQDR